jgi:signal transduction histidine kinase
MEATYRQIYRHPSPASARAEASGDAAVAIPFQPAGAFRTVSFASVLNGEVPPAFLRDHILLVGATAGGLGDRYRVPQREGGLISGIEIQANLINGLISDRLVRDVPQALRILLSLLPSGLLLVGFWRLTPARSLAASLALIAATLLVPALLLTLAGWWLPPTPALTGLLLVYPLWGWRRLQAIDRSIGQELAIFASEPLPTLLAPKPDEPLDPVGGQTARLRASIARMRDLRRLVSDTVESVGDPLLVTGLDDRVLLANGAASALLGAGIVGEHAMARLAGVSAAAPEAELTIGDGRTFSLRRSPLCDGSGAQRGWILLLADISAIRGAEREREEALEFLSHDMRSPQASILMLLEQAPAPGRDIGARIAGYARRTLALAEDFVQLARLNAGRFDPEETDLQEALIDAVDDIWPQSSSRGIRVEVEGDGAPCYMLGDRYALTRAFINLLDNAVRFSPDGGHIRCAMALVNGGRDVDCMIADNGPGIPEDRRAALFGRFGQRADSGDTRRSSGLGLAYVRAVAERHGGSARWEPGTPRGSRFIVRLPMP